jgi:hypothetical protein
MQEIWAAIHGWTNNVEISRHSSEDEAIEAAKAYAENNNISLSEMTVKPIQLP